MYVDRAKMGERAMSADSVYPADMHRGMADSRSMETMNMVSVGLVCKSHTVELLNARGRISRLRSRCQVTYTPAHYVYDLCAMLLGYPPGGTMAAHLHQIRLSQYAQLEGNTS